MHIITVPYHTLTIWIRPFWIIFSWSSQLLQILFKQSPECHTLWKHTLVPNFPAVVTGVCQLMKTPSAFDNTHTIMSEGLPPVVQLKLIWRQTAFRVRQQTEVLHWPYSKWTHSNICFTISNLYWLWTSCLMVSFLSPDRFHSNNLRWEV